MRKLTEEEKVIRREEIKEYNREYYKNKRAKNPEFIEKRKLLAKQSRDRKKDILAAYIEKYGIIEIPKK